MDMKLFAYENWQVDGVHCPISAVEGLESRQLSIYRFLADRFDHEVKRLGYDTESKIISEEQAKEAWLTMMEKSNSECDSAKQIAEELDWL